ncbi:hypothetical protein PLEOSDRAFT_166872 [Pleurotus ostreatus PC15]|uniref:DUF6534 domain-containing protein n=1 Tax=Pleurotus ostreatus (strain PC15) TaxID=1137138 RepID=A0A067NKU7_PLEO1|nr:hypothetical protein PLEOSDRAFT_166872 [Pleurotus ostreatus PC15]
MLAKRFALLATTEIVLLFVGMYYKIVDPFIPSQGWNSEPSCVIIPLNLSNCKYETQDFERGRACAYPVRRRIRTKLDGITLFWSSVKHMSVQAGATALADILCSIGLCHTLQSSRSGISRTDAVVGKLIKYSIHRAIATSTAAVLTVVLFDILLLTIVARPTLCYIRGQHVAEPEQTPGLTSRQSFGPLSNPAVILLNYFK